MEFAAYFQNRDNITIYAEDIDEARMHAELACDDGDKVFGVYEVVD